MAALLDEVGDSQSVRSSATSGTSRGKGPHEIDGRIFLRVKSCPCCGIKNTDLNLVQRGRYGPDFSKHTLWFRGTSENPDSRYCKLGVLTWQHGGFADQHETMDLYVAAMKKDVELQKQHEAAMKEMIAVVEEGRLRFKSGEKAKTSMRLQDARQSAVTSFKRQQLEVGASYRGIEKSTYEAMNPGRIARKGIKTERIFADGKWQDVVLVRNLPQGHYEVNAKFITGSMAS